MQPFFYFEKEPPMNERFFICLVVAALSATLSSAAPGKTISRGTGTKAGEAVGRSESEARTTADALRKAGKSRSTDLARIGHGEKNLDPAKLQRDSIDLLDSRRLRSHLKPAAVNPGFEAMVTENFSPSHAAFLKRHSTIEWERLQLKNRAAAINDLGPSGAPYDMGKLVSVLYYPDNTSSNTAEATGYFAQTRGLRDHNYVDLIGADHHRIASIWLPNMIEVFVKTELTPLRAKFLENNMKSGWQRLRLSKDVAKDIENLGPSGKTYDRGKLLSVFYYDPQTGRELSAKGYFASTRGSDKYVDMVGADGPVIASIWKDGIREVLVKTNSLTP